MRPENYCARHYRMNYRRLLFTVLTTIILAAPLIPSQPVFADNTSPTIGNALEASVPQANLQSSGCNAVILAAVNPAYEQRVVELVNIERDKVGLPPLKRVEALDQAARYHAQDMAVDAYFNHDSFDRTDAGLVKVCNWDTRIAGFYPAYSWLGENIAAGFGTPEDVMKVWMGSDGHRGNILNINYREFGVGFSPGGPFSSYWVQDFGTRSDSYPLVINREAAVTDTPQISLYLYGEGVWNEMRLRNDSGAWTGWRAFAKNVDWTLDWTQGVHTVSVEFRKTGQTTAAASSSDTIDLTTNGAALGNLPNEITFIYDREAHQLYPAAYELNPQNTLSGIVMNWQISISDTWIHTSTTSGITPSGTTVIQPDLQVLKASGEIQGTVTVAVSGGVQAIGSPKTIGVRLVAVNCLCNTLYLPSIRH